MSRYEHCLSYWPDHAEGIIGLSNLLMDIYEETMPAEEPEPTLLSHLASSSTTASGSTLNAAAAPSPRTIAPDANTDTPQNHPQTTVTPSSNDPSPAQLNRIAARDRAYMLLSTLTKLGTGADNPEAWLTLARSHELSKQTARAKKALWWVVKLEESRPLRDWSCVRR